MALSLTRRERREHERRGIYYIYYNGLQAVVQLVQQSLPTTGKSNYSIVAQAMRLDVSAGLQRTLEC